MGTPKPGFKVVEMEVDAKNVEWTGKNLEFAYRESSLGEKGLKNAYQQYLKEHPNSKISLSYFENNIYK